MDFSLPDSECWETSDFQENFLKNYSKKRQKKNGPFEIKIKKKKTKLSDSMTAEALPVKTNAIAKEKTRNTFDPYLHNKKQFGQYEKKMKRKKKLSNSTKAETFSVASANAKDEISIADLKKNSNEKIKSTLDSYHHKVSKIKSAFEKKKRKGSKQLKKSSNLTVEEETQSNIQIKLMKHANSQAASNKSHKKTETCKPNNIKIEMKDMNKPHNKSNSSATDLEKEYGRFENKIKKKKKKLSDSTKAGMVSVTTSAIAKEESRFADLKINSNEKIRSTIDLYHHIKLSEIETPSIKKKKKKSKQLKNLLSFTTEVETSSNVKMKLMKRIQSQSASNKSYKIRGICKSNSIKFETKDTTKSHNKSYTSSPVDFKVTKNKHKNPTSEKVGTTGSYDKLSISRSHEKVLKKKKSINKKMKSETVEKHLNESELGSEESSSSFFIGDDEETSDEHDEELRTELKNSKEYKYLLHFIQREEKNANDPNQNIENEADFATEKSSLSINNKSKVSLKVENILPGSSYNATNEDMNCSKEKANKSSKSSALISKAQKSLQAARFRLLNETLYTVSGQEASKYFRCNMDDFKDYHEGYRSQVMKWPINPVDIIIKDLYHKNTCLVIADMGCGEAKIASTFPDRKIFSFDLVALNKHVTCCDFSKVNLSNDSMDIVVFCLSLMGTNLKDYLFEAHRILKFGGELKIAEVESRIEDLKQFIFGIENFGFKLKKQNIAHRVFVFLDFDKVKKQVQKSTILSIKLKPCLYKKR